MTTAFGRPVVGDPVHYVDAPKEQWPVEELAALFDAAFAAGVTALTWLQYTPSWNDGDPCTFNAYSENFYYIGALEDEWSNALQIAEDYNDEADIKEEFTYPGNIYRAEDYDAYDWVGTYPNRTKVYKPDYVYPPAFHEARAVYEAIESGHFDVALTKNFGDPALVFATNDKFIIESYDPGY